MPDEPDYTCESCGHAPLEEFVVPRCTTMWHCRRCGLYQRGRLVEQWAYALEYHGLYAQRRRRKLRTAAVRLARIAAVVGVDRPKLLDVGCSVGATVEEAARRGWDAHGVDVSGDAVEYCRRLGLNCRTTDSVRLPFEDGTFDVVTGWHVIEHVRDAVETLAEWRRVLRPGGVLVLETPDSDCVKVRLRGANYRRFWTVEHTYTFNRRNFLPFVERAGLEVLSAPVLGHVGPLKTTMRAYAVGYALAKGLQRITGLSKAFQVFARRPRITVDPPHSPRPVGRMVRSSSPAAGQCEPPPSGEGYRAFRRGLLSTGDRLSDGF